jgi:PAS domain S-box-containing protein
MAVFLRWPKVGLWLLILALFAGSVWMYSLQREGWRSEIEKELTAIASLKAKQIADWRSAHLVEAEVLQRDAFLKTTIGAFLSKPTAKDRQDLVDRLRLLADQHGYSEILVLDTTGQERFRLHEGSPVHVDNLPPHLRHAQETGQPVFIDLYSGAADWPPNTSIIIPLPIETNSQDFPQGFLLLVSDASRFLFPLLQGWPTPSHTAETLLIRSEADHALILNEPRAQPGAALSLRVPLTDIDRVSVIAALGRQGYVQGTDYRGIEVVAVLVPIENTSWSLVAKIDFKEAFADWHTRAGLQWALQLSLLTLIVLSWLVFWQHLQGAHFKELHQCEIANRSAMEHQALLLRSIGEGVIATDAHGQINMMNTFAEQLTGWTSEAALGCPIDDVFVLADSRTGEPMAPLVHEVLAAEKMTKRLNQCVLVAKDGRRFHVSESAAPVMAEGGRMTGVVLVFRDGSESYRLREEIRQERYLLRLFVEQAPAAIAMLDRKMRYLAVSRRFLLDYGLGGQHILGQLHRDIFPNMPERWQAVHQSCLEGTVKECEEDSITLRNGQREWLRWTVHPWRESSGKIGGILFFSEIITWRKAAEEALQQSEAKFRTLFQKHAAVKLLIDPESGRILEANEAAEAFYGWSQAQLQQMRIHDINTLSPEQVSAELAKASREDRVHFEFRHRRADGSMRDVAVYSSAVTIHGKIVLHSIVHDITAFRQMEEQLRQAQKMESIGCLAGGVAHEFNNIMAVILGYGQLLLERTPAEDSRRMSIQEIMRAADRSVKITRQLLTFARQQPESIDVFELNSAVHDMLTMLERLVGEQIHMVWQPWSEPLPVVMDASKLDQVLMNLCINARDAITGSGTITIATSLVNYPPVNSVITPECTLSDFVLLTVQDDGSGMDEKTLERIFDPFFTTKAPGEGTGLGLPFVYGIVQQSKGYIEVDSSPGQGTTFKLYLPLACQGAEEVVDVDASIHRSTAGATILLVEDESPLLTMVRLMLEELGYQVLATSSAEEALELGQADDGREIDLLLTDVVLPEMGGKELAEVLQVANPNLKVLFMSGYALQASVSEEADEEKTNFLAKPFRMKDLAAKLQEILI